MADEPRHLIRTKMLPDSEARHIRHPLNPKSDVFIQPLSERVGMQRAVLSLARVPPGKESFLLHAHEHDEEFLYILEGEGTAEIGEQRVKVGPGDFMGFPIDGTPHHLVNTGVTDLVYLMGGERSALEVTRFPSAGKTIIFKVDQTGAKIDMFDGSTGRPMGFEAWQAKDDQR
jgi:uncharacterized cupin superfamily protein